MLASELLDCFNEFGFHQLVSHSTHTKSNTLDLIFVNFVNNNLTPVVISPGLSDHYTIELELRLDCRTNTRPPQLVKIYNRA